MYLKIEPHKWPLVRYSRRPFTLIISPPSRETENFELCCSSHRSKLRAMPAPNHRSEIPTSPLTTAIEIDRTALAALRPAACRRGLTVAALAVAILETAGREELVSAILNDGH